MRTFALLTLSCCILSGCAFGPAAAPSPTPTTGLAISGTVHGGQQAVVGAHLYLFAANTTGYGSASVSLLTSVPGSTTLDNSGGATNGDYYATSGANGAFTITGDYTCIPGQQVYLYATGGNSGSGNNASSSLIAVFGSCPATDTFATSTPFVTINEVTTVAAAYALAYFATDPLHISAPPDTASQTALANAFARTTLLVDLPSGVALATTPNGNGTAPQAMVNTLANILAACINSTGSTSSSCSTLFNSTPANTTAATVPADTATAAINIAQNPANYLNELFALSTASPPFSPALSSQPNSFTFAITFTAGSLNAPQALALDGNGNVWAVNSTSNSITHISPLGVTQTFTGNGLSTPAGIAVTSSNNVFVANSGTSGGVSGFNNAGSPLTNSPFTGGGIAAPTAIINDPSSNLWVLNSGNITVSELSSTGAAISSSSGYSFFLPKPTSPNGIASDTFGNIWVSDSVATNLYYFNSSISAFQQNPYPLSNVSGPLSLIGDVSGDLYFVNSGNTYLDEITDTQAGATGSSGGSSSTFLTNSALAIATGGPVAPALKALGATPIARPLLMLNTNGCVTQLFNKPNVGFCPYTTGSTLPTTVTYGSIVSNGFGDLWVTMYSITSGTGHTGSPSPLGGAIVVDPENYIMLMLGIPPDVARYSTQP